MQDVGDPRREPLEPPVRLTAALALGKDDRIVLVHRQQAFAAASRTEDCECETRRRIAEAFGLQLRFRQRRRAARELADLARDHRRHVASRNSFRHQRGGSARELGPGAGEIRRLAGRIDLVAKQNGFFGAQTQEVACRERAAEATVFVFHAEMPHLEPPHAADGAVDERICPHRKKRPARHERHRHRERIGTMLCDRTQDIALGHNARILWSRRRAALAVIGDDEQRGHPFAHHHRQRAADRRISRDDFRRRAHDVADAVAVGVSVDSAERAFGIEVARARNRLDPPGAVLIGNHLIERPARLLGLRQRAHVLCAQPRQQRQKDLSGRAGVSERRMPSAHLDAQPSGELIERVTGKIAPGDLAEQPDTQAARACKGQPGAVAFALEHRQIEADRMSDHHRIADKGGELQPHLGEGRRLRDRRVIDAMDGGDGGRDWHPGTHQPAECRGFVDPSAGDPDGRHLDHSGRGRIEPGGLGIEHDGVERNQRGRVETSHSQPLVR